MAAEAVIWTSKINAIDTLTGIKKSGGVNNVNDGGAISTQELVDGGYFEFVVPTITDVFITGFGTDAGLLYTNISHGFAFGGVASVEVRESGVYKTDFAFSIGDTFKITITGTTVRYYLNGVLKYTSATPVVLPTKADITFNTTDAEITNTTVYVADVGLASVPFDYPQAIFDLVDRAETPNPVWGPAGSKWTDDVYGHEILRLTDGNTASPANYSYRTPSAPNQMGWSFESDKIWVKNDQGVVFVFDIDPVVFTSNFNRSIAWGAEPAFPRVAGKSNIMYGVRGISNHVIEKYDFNANGGAGAFTTILDLKTIDGSLDSSVYTSSLYVSGGAVERCAVNYGGAGQDMHMKCCVFDINNPATRRVINTKNSTVDGVACKDKNGLDVVLDFYMHSICISHDGDTIQLAAAGTSAFLWIYSWSRNQFEKIEQYTNGHNFMGNTQAVNEDQGAGSKFQWQKRSLVLENADTPVALISAGLDARMNYHSDHQSWWNSILPPNKDAPFFSECQIGGVYPGTRGYWSNQIIGVRVTGGERVWRFCNHRASGYDANHNPYFDYQVMLQAAPNGKLVAFSSNMNYTLGTHPTAPAYANARVDVFIVRTDQLGPGNNIDEPVDPEYTDVPNLLGLTQSQAITAIVAAELSVGSITSMSSTLFAVGLVISQTVAFGSSVEVDSSVGFVVSSGPPPVDPTPAPTAALLAGAVMDEAASVYLNDSAKMRWTYDILLPYLRSALTELQAALEENDLPTIHELSATIPVSAGSGVVAAPLDMVLPLNLEERRPGETVWNPMTEINWDSDAINRNRLSYWVFREGLIYVPQTTIDQEVRLKYVRSLTTITNGNSPIEVPNALGFLAARTAALASAFGGSATTRATNANGRAEMFKKSILGSLTRRLQNRPVRRRGYNGRRRR